MDQGLASLLREAGGQPAPTNGKKGFLPSIPSFSFTGVDSSSLVQTGFTYLFYLCISAFIIFLLLVLVHYTYTPIFSFSSGDGGTIPIGSGVSDAQLTWNVEPPGSALKSNFDKILPCGFTLSLDIFVDRDLAVSNTERMILYRGRNAVVPLATRTLQANYPDSNLLIYLQNDTNDLVVSAVTFDAAGEYIESAPTVLNVPIRQPFRLSTIYLPNLLEVYMNGRFIGSRVLKGKPKQTSTQFFPPPEKFQQTVKILNVSYWSRPLLAREIASAPPPFPIASDFKPSDLTQCAN
jgi:hypothetical protein